MKSFIQNLLRRNESTPSMKQLQAIPMQPTDFAIDCGANVGVMTDIMAHSGAKVYAFEPNPAAFAVLKKKFQNSPNVTCIPKGVFDEPGTAPLFLHQNAEQDQLHWSTGSSLLATKSNVKKDNYVTVELVDLADFIHSLQKRVRILKLDVEGVECRILRKLISTGLILMIDHVFVETHDHKIPGLKAETDEIRHLILERKLEHVRLDWV
jgi:FkbM family methyltransferase